MWQTMVTFCLRRLHHTQMGGKHPLSMCGTSSKLAIYRYRQVGVSLFGAFAILSNPWLGKSILEIDFHIFFELLIVFSIERCPSQVANTFSACVASDIVLLKSTRGLGASSCNKFFLSNPKVLYIICGRP